MAAKKLLFILILSLFTLLKSESVYEYRELLIDGKLHLAYVLVEYNSNSEPETITIIRVIRPI